MRISLKIRKQRKGFTVAEAVVVFANFSLLAVSFSEIFVRTSRASIETAQRVLIQSDTRTIVEAIVRAVRVSNIDYALYGGELPGSSGAENPVILTELDLDFTDGDTKYRIKQENSDVGCWNDGKSYPCIVVSTDAGVTWSPLSPRNSKVTRLIFLAGPGTDPFLLDPSDGTYSQTVPPMVTINLALKGFAISGESDWEYSVQTMVTPRYYKR